MINEKEIDYKGISFERRRVFQFSFVEMFPLDKSDDFPADKQSSV